MKRLLVLGTIAALALSSTAEAKPHNGKPDKGKKASRQVMTRQQVHNTGTARYAPAGTRTAVRRYSNGSYYGGGGYYPYYGSGSSFSIGIGTGYGYPGYGYGYGYPYSNYGYGGYPYGYNSYGSGYARGNVVVVVQRRLASAGYYGGVVDGVAGGRTRAAIARWEARHGMYADGRIDRELLRSLGLA